MTADPRHLADHEANAELRSEIARLRSDVATMDQRLASAYAAKHRCNEDANFERLRANKAESECERLKVDLATYMKAANEGAAENERLREALRPFAEVGDCYDDAEDDNHEVWQDAGPIIVIAKLRSAFRLKNFRRARALTAQQEGDGDD